MEEAGAVGQCLDPQTLCTLPQIFNVMVYTEMHVTMLKPTHKSATACTQKIILPPPLAYIPTGTAPGKPAFSRQLHNPLPAVLVSASFGLFAINFALLGISPSDVLSCL